MNIKLVAILGIVSALLVSALCFEYFYAQKSRNQLLSSIAKAKSDAELDEMPTIELGEEPEDSYADLVDRPLFVKGRKPVIEPPPENQQTAALAAAAAKPFEWQLNGVYTTKKGLFGLFSRTAAKVPKDNFRKLGEGADLEGWKVTKVTADKVILALGSEQKELPLRKVKPKDNKTRPGLSPPQAGGDAHGRPPQAVPPPGVLQPPPVPEPPSAGGAVVQDPDDQPIETEPDIGAESEPELETEPDTIPEQPNEYIENNNNAHF